MLLIHISMSETNVIITWSNVGGLVRLCLGFLNCPISSSGKGTWASLGVIGFYKKFSGKKIDLFQCASGDILSYYGQT